MKKTILMSAFAIISMLTYAIEPAKVKPVKNVILMIADGNSIGVLGAARWLQYYRDPSITSLNVDPWMSGTVITCNSDAPIGDSAPTTSCYMTGHRSRAGYVATFPPYKGKANIGFVDSTRAYAPAATLLEAATQLKGKSAGLVFTCQFPHATPADCSSHYYNRGAYGIIADQMVHNNLDVVIGGGTSYLNKPNEEYLKSHGVNVYRDDIAAMRKDKSNKMWALFSPADMDYDIDRNPDEQPSIAEMTETAISKLSKNKNGFFLMVEGSKTDWAAHANDPGALLNDFLAFDKACGVALDFARRDGNTVVIITSDHGNSGFTLGRYGLADYSHLSVEQLFETVSKYKLSGDGIENKMNTMPFDSLKSIFKQYTSIDLSKEEINLLVNNKGYKNSPIPEELRTPDKESPLYSSYLSGVITKILSAHTPFGWTSNGHTGEDVFLACYHPNASQRITGVNTNVQLAEYMQSLFGVYGKMQQFNDHIFARHTDVFKGYEAEIVKPEDKKSYPVLNVKNPSSGKHLTIRPFTNSIEVTANGKTTVVELPSVITYVDRNDMFYLPADLTKYLK
ncbi:MAG: alkaline phosphatase [Bacteroidaceae bacterium]